MGKVNVFYSEVFNMGDMLNKDLIEKCFKCEVVRKSVYTADIVCIGSGLANYLYDNNKKKNIKKRIMGLLKSDIYVWGTGFIDYSKKKNFFKKNMKFCAVRGNLTKKMVEEIFGKKLDIPTGDGGILSSYLLNERPTTKFDVGIISHFREKDEPKFQELLKKYENATFIDVQDTPENVTRKIAECKTVLSSSLHGLIIADSLGVPNKHIVVSDKLLGDGFKFDDYYSAYNLKHEYVDLNKNEINSIEQIINDYKITKEMVDQKKKDMIECFPFK